MERNSLLVDKSHQQQDENFKWSFFMSYSIHHNQIKAIINKHWDILKNDCILVSILQEGAKVIYRGAPSLRGMIAPM